MAGGSADETRVALLIAETWAYIDHESIHLEVAERLGRRQRGNDLVGATK